MDARKMASTAKKRKPRVKQTKRRVPSLAKRLAAIGDKIPDEALADIPTDYARNLDHYLYGAPRQD